MSGPSVRSKLCDIIKIHRIIVEFDYGSMENAIVWTRPQDMTSIKKFTMNAAEELLFTGDFSSSA